MKLSHQLASICLQAGQTNGDCCGANGLPITPNSISILGNFRSHVQSRRSDRLVQYLSCKRSKHERLTFVFEHWPAVTSDELNTREQIDRLVIQTFEALAELHVQLRISHGCINQASIVTDSSGHFRLHNWPFNWITENGRLLDASSLLGVDIRFVAPERLMRLEHQSPGRKSDVWSLALVLLSLMEPSIRLPANPSDFLLCKSSREVFRLLAIKQLPDHLQPVFAAALNPLHDQRADVRQLLALLDHSSKVLQFKPLFDKFVDEQEDERQQSSKLWRTMCKDSDKSCPFTLEELEHLWQLASGRQKQSHHHQSSNSTTTLNAFSICPHILAVPRLILLESPSEDSVDKRLNGLSIGSQANNSTMFASNRVALLPAEVNQIDLTKLEQRFNQIPLMGLYPLVHDEVLTSNLMRSESVEPDSFPSESETDRSSLSSSENSKVVLNSLDRNSSVSLDGGDASDQISTATSRLAGLPTQIKESDVSYQCERLLLFRRLLDELPITRNRLAYEASIDIPPFYRARTWAALLDVRSADLLMYSRLDKISVGSADRQLAVDIPRCHQYDELLASPAGHAKLKRILKAWLAANEADCVYWQGLDSLCAPFVSLQFHDEASAFACLNAFTRKYLQGFFAPDNAPTVRRYLAQFSQLLAFHDPRLAQHLHSFAFYAELYAIPWFLTMFTHVLPLYKLLHVWDAFLQSGPSFPLAFGLAILRQLRPRLLTCSFNDCILLFSDLPDVHVEACVSIARKLFSCTPESLLERQVF